MSTIRTYSIPSVIEANSQDLDGVSAGLIDGLKILHSDNISYIIGELAAREGVMPHKTINSSPDDKDYRLLAEAALLLASKSVDGPFCLTTGFPYVSYQLFRQKAYDYFQDNHLIRYFASTFSGGSLEEQSVSVTKAAVIPELHGCNLAIRKAETPKEGSFFLASLGYGTFETALTTPSGIVQRTAVSGPGIRYAVQTAIKDLLRTHNVGLNAEHLFDQGFKNGKIVLNRTAINIEEIRKKHLSLYFDQVIAPILSRTYTDKDYSNCRQIVLAGGGALYEELVVLFLEYFDGILEVSVQPEPALCASQGYAINSMMLSKELNATPIGIDIGNATTVLSYISDSKNWNFSFNKEYSY